MPGLTQQLEGWGRRKPPPGTHVNWQHRLARGLAGGWLFNEGGGAQALDITGRNLPGTPTGGPFRTRGPDGLVLSLDGVDDVVIVPHSAVLMPSEGVTVATRIRANPAVAPANFDFVVGKLGSESWADGYGMYWTSATSLRGWVSQYASVYAELAGLNAALWHTAVMTYSQVQGQARLWVDGIQGTSSGAFVAPIPANTGALNIGQAFTSTYNFNGQIDWLYVWGRALHPGEVQLISRYPYDMLAPPPPRRFVSVPGPVDLAAADALALADSAAVTSALLTATEGLTLSEQASVAAVVLAFENLTLADLAGLQQDITAADAFALIDAASLALAVAAAEGITLTDAALAALVLPPGAVDPGATCDYDARVMGTRHGAAVGCPTGEEWDPL